MDYQRYYNSLQKPFFAPPSNIFGIVWPVLYLIIIVSFGWVLYRILAKRVWSFKLGVVFIINLVANALYTPLFFNWRLPFLATLDILVVWITILFIMKLMWNQARWVTYAQIPYVLWVSFATILQILILFKN